MPELPDSAFIRAARMAALPAAYAGRTVLGLGKRVIGQSAEAVAEELQRRTADQMFAVFGELKGGAMKVGQALSIFESALPPQFTEPYRATLVKLQDSAPPLPAASMHRILAAELGEDWRARFAEFDDQPIGAASIGQVHKAIWRDGRTVAVKIQYPGADKALRADLKQIARMVKLFDMWAPAMDLGPVIEELVERAEEELDYLLESRYQRTFAAAYADDPEFIIPRVVMASPHVLISEWMEGISLSEVIKHADQPERDRVGTLLTRFLLSGPMRVGLLHADTHPGNFKVAPDGRLIVLDFGAVNSLPSGLPPEMGTLIRIAHSGNAEAFLAGMRDNDMVLPEAKVSAEELLHAIAPFMDLIREDEFHYNRQWLNSQFTRLTDVRKPDFYAALQLNLPRTYLYIYRVVMSTIAVLSQLESTVPMRSLLEEMMPGFAEPATAN